MPEETIESEVEIEQPEEEIELEPNASEKDDDSVGLTSYEMQSYPADFTLEVLLTKWKNKDIKIPEIQRKYVWNLPQASRLIESFLLGLPVPSIFLYEEKGSGQLLVVDGQQRMRSVIFFLEEQFGDEKNGKTTTFRLKLSENSPWNGLKYTQLDEDDQRKIRNAVLRAFIMRQLSPDDKTSIQHVFERLNTGGTQLTLQEVRNCVYDGPFNQLLHKLNQDANWRAILGKQVVDKRQKDIELILRFLALRFGGAYKEPMKDFLGGFMATVKGGQRNGEFEADFTKTVQAVKDNLGEKPFHIKAGLNVAVFDSVCLAFSKHLGTIGDDHIERYKALVKDPIFLELVGQNTTTIKRVTDRIKVAEQTLFPGA